MKFRCGCRGLIIGFHVGDLRRAAGGDHLDQPGPVDGDRLAGPQRHAVGGGDRGGADVDGDGRVQVLDQHGVAGGAGGQQGGGGDAGGGPGGGGVGGGGGGGGRGGPKGVLVPFFLV